MGTLEISKFPDKITVSPVTIGELNRAWEAGDRMKKILFLEYFLRVKCDLTATTAKLAAQTPFFSGLTRDRREF